MTVACFSTNAKGAALFLSLSRETAACFVRSRISGASLLKMVITQNESTPNLRSPPVSIRGRGRRHSGKSARLGVKNAERGSHE